MELTGTVFIAVVWMIGILGVYSVSREIRSDIDLWKRSLQYKNSENLNIATRHLFFDVLVIFCAVISGIIVYKYAPHLKFW